AAPSRCRLRRSAGHGSTAFRRCRSARRGSPGARRRACWQAAASRLAGNPGDVRRHAIAIGLRHSQAAFGPPPEYVVTAARPFLVDEIVDFGRGETLTEVLAEIGRR